MSQLSKQSKRKLNSCHHDWKEIIYEAIERGPIDFSVICGYRNQTDQLIAYQEGKSKLEWPNSKHNPFPSLAIDLAPYNNGINWNELEPFYHLAGVILGIAKVKKINVRWGGAWDGKLNIWTGRKFVDLPHFELIT